MILFGILGLLLISYALWLKDEKRQDIIFIIGGIALLVYSAYIQDAIFIILQIIFIASAGMELWKIMRKKPNATEHHEKGI